MRKWSLAKEAQSDMRDIRLFSKQHWGEEQSIRYINEIRGKIDLIARNPLIGKDCSDHIEVGIRSIFIGSHTIYYEFNAETLTVRAILHQAMIPHPR
jgi:toxin ParE1/3/4